MPNTIRLHRVLATSPEKVYRAFIEGDALAKWLPPNGFACTVHHLQAKVGGTAHYDDRDHLLRSIATTRYDRLRPV